MDDFPGNSDRSKTAKSEPKAQPGKIEKHIEKVVVGEVIEKKKPFFERFKGVFFSGDIRTVTSVVAQEVLIPAIRNLVYDTLTKGAERTIFGDSYSARRGPSQMGNPQMRYNAYNTPVQRPGRGPGYLPDQSRRGRQGQNEVPDFLLKSQEEADMVLERMINIIDQFDVVSVADLRDLMGLPTTFIDNKWGWTDLHYATIQPTRDGYLLDLPAMEPL